MTLTNTKWQSPHQYSSIEVSEQGEVRYTKTKKLIKIKRKPFQQPYVSFSHEGQSRTKVLSLLVAETYLLASRHGHNPPVIHKDGNKLNNNVNNLEWVKTNLK